MAIKVVAELVFTEEEFEALGFTKQGDIIENMLSHSDWDIEIMRIQIDTDETVND